MDAFLKLAINDYLTNQSDLAAHRLASLVCRSSLPSNLEIHKMLACSTAHLNITEENLIDYRIRYDNTNPKYEFSECTLGYFVNIIEDLTEEEERAADEEFPNLKNIAKIALENGCTFLLLSVDAPTIPGLQNFDE